MVSVHWSGTAIQCCVMLQIMKIILAVCNTLLAIGTGAVMAFDLLMTTAMGVSPFRSYTIPN